MPTQRSVSWPSNTVCVLELLYLWVPACVSHLKSDNIHPSIYLPLPPWQMVHTKSDAWLLVYPAVYFLLQLKHLVWDSGSTEDFTKSYYKLCKSTLEFKNVLSVKSIKVVVFFWFYYNGKHLYFVCVLVSLVWGLWVCVFYAFNWVWSSCLWWLHGRAQIYANTQTLCNGTEWAVSVLEMMTHVHLNCYRIFCYTEYKTVCMEA